MGQDNDVRRARARGMDMMGITMLMASGMEAATPVDMADLKARKALVKGRSKKDRSKNKAAKASRKKNRK